MSEMDMIPGDYRQSRSGRYLLRRFIVACAVVLCCIGLARVLLGYLIWRENVQVVRLEQQEQAVEQNRARTEKLRQQKQVTEQQLAALNKLRGRDRVAHFLRSIDNVYIEGVWLESLHFMRRNGTGTLQAPGAANSGIIVVAKGAETAQSLQINQGAEMFGHAMNYTRLAEFMRNLGKQPTVADLRLIDTGTRNYTNFQVVDFKLSLKLDEKVQEQP